ncbi:MAG: NHL repeat-containing protein [Mycobacterium sp.]
MTAYPAASNGDVSPLAPAPTGISEPIAAAVDASGNIYAINACTNTVTIYAKGSKGDAAPIAVIGGSNTGLTYPFGIALDSNRDIYVANYNSASVTIYPPLGSSTGLLNEAPIATISGGNTGLAGPLGIALDSSRNIYVADVGATSVFVYPPLGSSTGTLNEFPTATITGSDTLLEFPHGIALDSTSGNIYVADTGAQSVIVYPPLGSSTGVLDELPTAVIAGGNTGLSSPTGITLDSSHKIYVDDDGSVSVFVYPALGSSTGVLNEFPTAAINGSSTDLLDPLGIALDSSSKVYVADYFADSLFVYPAIGSSTGTLNEAPSAAISTTITTGLGYPQGIALDSSGKIYVADDGFQASDPGSVFVYPAGSNANAAPIATISGPDTGLSYPFGIALDSNRNIYVADVGATSVFVYPALGSSSGTLDETPTATIAGPDTLLESPFGVALDSSGKIYVADTYAQSVFVYPALGSSTGTLNELPIAAITGPDTLLETPFGIALDSSRNIYVADEGDQGCDGTASVFVYSSGSTGDQAPLATISGSNTNLCYPEGIELDAGGNIYVGDIGAESVFVYPPLGSSTGLLNESPSATISGPFTELAEPVFVAIEPASGPSATATKTPTPTATATATGGTPTATATATKTVTPTATATATGGTPTATATATKTATPTATETPSTTTTLSASPSKIKFGDVDATATSKPEKVTLTNKGTAAASIGSITATSPFVIGGGTNTCSGQSIAIKKKCTFDVEFAPATVADVTGGSIEVSYNGTNPTVSLSGDGIAVTLKAPSKQKFSSVVAGGTGKPAKLKISNPATVKLGTTIVGGSDPADFTIASNTCTGTLSGKGRCTITMEFTPKTGATGTQSATVGFSYTYGANGGDVSISLSGTVK